MKVVINKCFGGFGLSTEAMKLLIQRGSSGIKIMTEKEYRGDGPRPTYNTLADCGDGYECSEMMPHILYKYGNVYMFDGHNDESRTDRELVAVVEILGARANGPYAELAIVNVPDGTKWHIHDYDGSEHVAQDHETWG